MNRAAEQPEPNPLREGLSARAVPQPCIIVIFGATGDLTHRKLIPALYNLAADGDLELVFRPDPSAYDGRFTNNGWMLELPRPLSKLSWDNVAMVSPATARRLGLAAREVVMDRFTWDAVAQRCLAAYETAIPAAQLAQQNA